MRKILIALLLLTLCTANAQQLTQEQVDSETYTSFINKEYKTTIKIGKQSLKAGIDFYYLRYRMGVSYYENKNYEAAIPHFEKAKALDGSDSALLEYLYYAYLNSSQREKANLLADTFTDELKVKVEYAPRLFKSVAAEVGILKTNNFDNYKNNNFKGNANFGHGTFYSDVQFENIFMNNQLSSRFKLQNIISLVTNTSNDIFRFSFPSSRETIITNKNNYFQWNTIGSYYLKNWTVSAGFGVYSSSSISYTAPPPFPPNQPFLSEKKNVNSISGSLSISKRLKYFEPTLAVSYTNLSELKTISSEGSVSYFPFGNLNLYGNSKIALVSNESVQNTIFTQLIGFKISKKIWLECFGASGNHENYISDNGLFVYNSPNKINWYAGSNLNFYFKNIDLSFGYGIQERGSTYESGANPTTTNTTNFTYNYNLIKTKIVWKL